jgi:glycosyltransferase involved in cell wall biosynthesis
VMIVKDEQHYIVPALESVKNFIDYWVILDSHSTDDTEGYAKMVLQGVIPGEYHQYDKPFRGDEKRTAALQLARDKADYLLMIDADNIFESDGPGPFRDIDQPAYMIMKDLDGFRYPIVQLMRSDMDWRFEGVIHEFPVSATPCTPVMLPGVLVYEASRQTGERSQRDLTRHYYNHALLLEREIFDKGAELEPYLLHRYTFYAGQSYNDCGFYARSLELYRIRAKMGGYDEEVAYSLLMIATVLNKNNAPRHEILQAALQAWQYRPQRLECAMFLMEVLIADGLDLAALTVGRHSAGLQPCNDRLFLNKKIYDTDFPALLQQLEEKFNLALVTN